MLENGVSAQRRHGDGDLGQPSAQGRFPQVSGLCFIVQRGRCVREPGHRRGPPGRRRLAATGADPVDLTAGSTYTIAENDFMANGGDGYPNFSSRMTSQDIMEEVVADYITANTADRTEVLGGAAPGRITCQDADTGAGPNCPTVASP